MMLFEIYATIVFLFIGSYTQSNYSTTDCYIGPNFWCLNEMTESLCDIGNKSLGVCGYSNQRCPVKTGDDFCKVPSSFGKQSPFEYSGGLTGVYDNYFYYYTLSLYWPPTSCRSQYNETVDLLSYFCSPYTDLDQPGSERLVLHGLWPTFATYGNYQGWPEYCSTKQKDWSVCHINGDLCPWRNSSEHTFTEAHYEYCLAAENVEQCLVNTTEVLLPEFERLKILAPGYLNRYNLFINHEWTKHGTCCSSIFGHNISNYLSYMLDLTDALTRPGSLIYENIQRYAGEKIGLTYLLSALNQTSIVSCNSKCELEELWICMDRDNYTGLPTAPMPCPAGARYESDSCTKAQCEYVIIPIRHRRQNHESGEDYVDSIRENLIRIVAILILLKFVLFFCGGCFRFMCSFQFTA